MTDLAAILGGSGRARLLWKALADGLDVWGEDAAALTAGTVRQMLSAFAPPQWQVVAESAAPCGTRKLLLRLDGGSEIETVLIPSHEELRTTLCVSSQVVRMAAAALADARLSMMLRSGRFASGQNVCRCDAQSNRPRALLPCT